MKLHIKRRKMNWAQKANAAVHSLETSYCVPEFTFYIYSEKKDS